MGKRRIAAVLVVVMASLVGYAVYNDTHLASDDPTPAPIPAPTGPKAVITGPTSGAAHSATRLDFSESVGDDTAWAIVPDKGNYVSCGNSLTLIPDQAGEYDLFLFAAGTVNGKTALVHAKHHVSITDGAGPVPPGPTPPGPTPPEPMPDPAEGPLGLVLFSKNQAASVPLDPAQRVASAKALAGSFTGIAAAIAAGTLKDEDAIHEQLKASNAQALGANKAAWTPCLIAIQGKLDQLDTAGKLNFVADEAEAYREIATGLGAVQ